MTLLAQQRCALAQQCRVDRPVRGMTETAILCHRRMFPQQWSTFLGMTGVTGFIQCRPAQQRGCGGTVRGMTFAATHLTEAHRVTGRFEKFGALFLVAGETNIGLAHLVEHGVMRRMDGVTTGTGNLAGLVRTTLPGDMAVALVASEAHAVLICHGRFRIGAEIQYRWAFLS